MPVRFLSVGDRALVVEFGDAIDRGLSREVLRLDRVLRAAPSAGIVETVPTFRSLMVHYDPLSTSRADLEQVITGLLDRDEGAGADARLWHIPVCYEGEFAPDLAEVARLTGLSAGDVVALHSGARYHVYMLGFLPGFPYLGDLPAALALPRRADPRVRVPAGSIAIATTLTAIYPYESPGGWHLIGATPIRLFDPGAMPPALLAAGDAVQFEPIDPAAFAAIRARGRALATIAIDSEPIGSMSAALKVLTPGLHTTVQDLGRIGWQALGVPVSGALDGFSLRLGNRARRQSAGDGGARNPAQRPELRGRRRHGAGRGRRCRRERWRSSGERGRIVAAWQSVSSDARRGLPDRPRPGFGVRLSGCRRRHRGAAGPRQRLDLSARGARRL